MEIAKYLQFLLFILCGLGGIAILIFVLRKQDQGLDYDKIIKELNEQKETNLKTLKEGNKEIDKIEQKILECKKELHLPLFKKRKK